MRDESISCWAFSSVRSVDEHVNTFFERKLFTQLQAKILRNVYGLQVLFKSFSNSLTVGACFLVFRRNIQFINGGWRFALMRSNTFATSTFTHNSKRMKTLTTPIRNIQSVFKPSIDNVVSTGKCIAKIGISVVLCGLCKVVGGKMDSRHPFSYSGLNSVYFTMKGGRNRANMCKRKSI